MSDTLGVICRLSFLFVAALSITLFSGAYGHGFGVNRLSSLSDAVGAASFTYDEQAHEPSQSQDSYIGYPSDTITVTPASGSAVVRSYNQAERLANVTVGGTQTAAYAYDAFGRRASKVLTKSGSVYLYDVTGHMLEEAAQTSGALVTDNIFLIGAPVAQITPSKRSVGFNQQTHTAACENMG